MAPPSQAPGSEPAGQPVTDATAATDPAYGIFSETCGFCHDAERIVARRRTKAEWQDIITQMIDKGAAGSEDDFQKIFMFVRRHYGKLYINGATQDELTTTLGVSAKDADAILAYRKDKGNFADLDAIKKVPGIDTKMIDDHKEAIEF